MVSAMFPKLIPPSLLAAFLLCSCTTSGDYRQVWVDGTPYWIDHYGHYYHHYWYGYRPVKPPKPENPIVKPPVQKPPGQKPPGVQPPTIQPVPKPIPTPRPAMGGGMRIGGGRAR